MDNVSIKVTGLAELETKLLQMGTQLGAKAIVGAAYSENKKVVDAARANIISNGSVDTGLLHNSIVRKKLIYAKDGKVVIITGVNKSTKGVDNKNRPRVPWRYAHLVEQNKPFMEPAQESTKDAVVNGFVSNLEKRIKKFLKKQ